MWQRLKNTKTLKVVLAAVLTAWGMYLGEQIGLTGAIEATGAALLTLCLRDGIAKPNK